jgi:hypothetical protein
MAYISFKPTDYMSTKLYTGNASTNAITGVGFTPAFAWFKSRSNTNSHAIFDVLRGTNSISPSNNAINYNASGDGFTSLDSDGYTFSGTGSGGGTNASGFTYVGWNWKAGTTSGLSGGTITPINYSFNATSKVSVVAYTGNGTSGATVPHGLGVKPAAMFVKNTSGSVNSWAVYHKAMTATSYLELDVTNAKASNAGRWNNTEPTTSLFSLGNSATTNGSGNTYIAYIFGEVPGFSKFTEYTGSGNADGPFVYCGFEPQWLMIKETDSSSGWCMWDNKRPESNPGYWNVNSNFLQANDTGMESNNANLSVDFLSNGFKVRNSAGDINGAANNYVVFAFANNPIVGNNDTPGVAR